MFWYQFFSTILNFFAPNLKLGSVGCPLLIFQDSLPQINQHFCTTEICKRVLHRPSPFRKCLGPGNFFSHTTYLVFVLEDSRNCSKNNKGFMLGEMF